MPPAEERNTTALPPPLTFLQSEGRPVHKLVFVRGRKGMPARKGTRPPAAGRGRPRGAKNKLSTNVKDMIVAALNGAGGVEYLARQAEQNPAAFMGLISKILPLQIGAESDSRPVNVKAVTMSPLEAYRAMLDRNPSPTRPRPASR